MALASLKTDGAVEPVRRAYRTCLERATPPDWSEPESIRWALTELGARTPVVPPLTARLRATAADNAPGWPSTHFIEIINDLADHAQVILYSQFWRVDASRTYGISGPGLDWELDWTAPWEHLVEESRAWSLLEASEAPVGDNIFVAPTCIRPSLVNVSCVQPLDSIDGYGETLDVWLSVLSRLGFHARHISVYGRTAVWQRRQVMRITLRFRHLALGDIVLLWNEDNPERLAVDLGTSLERLALAKAIGNWNELVFGPMAGAAPPATLDAIRTATLLVGNGITPAARGAGRITRRVISTIEPDSARLGVSAAVRSSTSIGRPSDRFPRRDRPSLPASSASAAAAELTASSALGKCHSPCSVCPSERAEVPEGT
ncbi:hypothetical protein [Streptomyces sp. NPDC057496]|uniref:hypothetical protein n=1 Tax=Streptomyces sp. NPDC057496 TaxID=3346149 RepID=UPI0036AB8E40